MSKRLDAGPFEADIRSFRLNLAAENKADKTVRVHTDAVRWFAAADLLRGTGKARWEQVEPDDVRRWMVQLLGEYSDAYAYQQFRSLRQFFRWLAAEDGIADPMAGLRPPKVADKPVRISAAKNFPGSSGPAGGTRSRTGATPRSSRCCWRPGSGSPS